MLRKVTTVIIATLLLGTAFYFGSDHFTDSGLETDAVQKQVKDAHDANRTSGILQIYAHSRTIPVEFDAIEDESEYRPQLNDSLPTVYRNATTDRLVFPNGNTEYRKRIETYTVDGLPVYPALTYTDIANVSTSFQAEGTPGYSTVGNRSTYYLTLEQPKTIDDRYRHVKNVTVAVDVNTGLILRAKYTVQDELYVVYYSEVENGNTRVNVSAVP